MTNTFESKLKALKDNPVALLLLILFLLEGITKYCLYQGWDNVRISAGFKLVLEAYFIIRIAQKSPKQLIYVGLLSLSFLIGQVFLVGQDQLLENSIFLSKYLFIILMLTYVSKLSFSSNQLKNLFWLFEKIIILNSVLIVLGLAFDIYFLETYTGQRFGYNGLFLRSGASSYVYWIALFYWLHRIIVLKENKWLSLLLILFAAILLGTKIILLALFSLPLFVFLVKKGYRNKWLLSLLALIIVAFVLAGPWLLEQLINSSDTFAKIAKNDGWFAALTSLRSQLFVEETWPIIANDWQWYNYLFGGATDMHYRSQFGLFDLLFFFGIIGTTLYLYTFGKFFLRFKLNSTALYFIAVTLVLQCAAANFFYDTVVAIYLVIIALYLGDQFPKDLKAL